MNIGITGGFGFIGANLVNYMTKKYPEYSFCIMDDEKHYAANPSNVKRESNLALYKSVDIRNRQIVDDIFNCERFDAVIHLAAESHVDNSIKNPLAFVETNVMGTVNLLHAAQKYGVKKFYHISTDEVYGHLEKNDPQFTEETPYSPRSPYSASKASADHLVRAWHHTFDLPILISNCSNNYGPFQHDEKLIPTVIRNIIQRKPIPVYGDGTNIRDWLYVEDHCKAIDTIFQNGKIGETYNIGGEWEEQNIAIVEQLCDLVDSKIGTTDSRALISFVEDRKGHDYRYGINIEKIRTQLFWEPSVSFTEGLNKTVDWYIKKYETQSTNTSQVQE